MKSPDRSADTIWWASCHSNVCVEAFCVSAPTNQSRSSIEEDIQLRLFLSICTFFRFFSESRSSTEESIQLSLLLPIVGVAGTICTFSFLLWESLIDWISHPTVPASSYRWSSWYHLYLFISFLGFTQQLIYNIILNAQCCVI